MKTVQMWLLVLAVLLIACEAPTQAPRPTQSTGSPQPISQSTTTPVRPAATSMPASTQAATPFATAVATEPAGAPTSLAPAASATPAPRVRATIVPAATATATPLAQATITPTERQAHVFPVQSDRKISYGKTHHDYPAADIFCAIGSQFVAVAAGVVDFVSREDRWDAQANDGATRGGLAVAIVGDDGVRYYGSHLSEVAEGIAPGTRVVAGQLLGLTGHSGDAIATPPHLHFGISRPTTADDWALRRGEIAPYQYLKAWQRGENSTPKLQ